MSDWYNKFNEKLKKGYVDLTQSSPNSTPPEPEFEPNKEHIAKVNKVYTVLNVNKDKIDGSKEHIRDVGALRKSLKDKKSLTKGKLSKEDMIYLNELWKKIKHYAKK